MLIISNLSAAFVWWKSETVRGPKLNMYLCLGVKTSANAGSILMHLLPRSTLFSGKTPACLQNHNINMLLHWNMELQDIEKQLKHAIQCNNCKHTHNTACSCLSFRLTFLFSNIFAVWCKHM